ncbi:hypothetical protein Plhal304r1_c029g0095271 [Plasmopara halstedii]
MYFCCRRRPKCLRALWSKRILWRSRLVSDYYVSGATTAQNTSTSNFGVSSANTVSYSKPAPPSVHSKMDWQKGLTKPSWNWPDPWCTHYMRLELEWWVEAVRAGLYTVNRLPNTARPFISPFEMFYGKKLELSHFRVFGARRFVHIDKSKRSKWDPKAHNCIFLIYSETSRAYRVWKSDAERAVTTRTVLLDESPPDSHCNVYSDGEAGTRIMQWSILDDEDLSSPVPSPQPAPDTNMEIAEDLATADC